MTDRYALIGHPVAQSLSPLIHARFAERTGQDMTYELLDAPPERFAAAVAEFRAAGGKGMNVTLPHKAAACALADRVGEHARATGAANTLIFGEELVADNTDGVGLVRDLAQRKFAVDGRAILILGAGGACRGIIPPLLKAGVGEIVITARTPKSAAQIAEAMASYGAVRASPDGVPPRAGYDAVINATSASLSGELPTTPSPDDLEWGYDLAYAKGSDKTVFVEWLEAHGVRALDGYGMLIEQAAESFYLWRGVRPRTDDLLDGPRLSAIYAAPGEA